MMPSFTQRMSALRAHVAYALPSARWPDEWPRVQLETIAFFFGGFRIQLVFIIHNKKKD